ncbi:MAG: response regulator [Proteobacteria bacterium]|nr:response regulator [Pseudomonadota bacterium]
MEHILVVDDTADIRGYLGAILKSAGYHVHEAENGSTVIELLESHPVDLLVTDVVMPRMDGRELAVQLNPLRPRTQVLFVSGYTDHAVLRDGELDAGTTFLQKPYTPTILAQKIREILDAAAQSA